ncbi:MAG: CRISPR-associated helicase Cas3' [Capsulimonadales bacterium]|nr:CRISPR-associated helicase Cas3' [Capsulimonadales bacterium]
MSDYLFSKSTQALPDADQFVAHTPSRDNPEWHDLVDHTLAVAHLAESFATPFGGAATARYVGLLHDLGKFDDGFQNYLRQCFRFDRGEISEKPQPGSAPHKQTGALLAHAENAAFGDPLAQVLFGHHGGMKNRQDTRDGAQERQQYAVLPFPALVERARSVSPALVPPFPDPGVLYPPAIRTREAAEMYLRFVFSCLVDADALDTEKHVSPDTARQREEATRRSPPLADLRAAFLRDQERLRAEADAAGNGENPVHQVRRAVFADCLARAVERPGVFTLTVPTGGGKTRSSLAFALEHAVRHGKRRIIYAAPFTSILDQTAAVFEGIFGENTGIVLEHHSAAEIDTPSDDATDNGRETALRRRLAAENWDAPLIVTTQVQLFESLFSQRPARCRKLHRIADSVLLLDEVQSLPAGLLRPLIEALKTLAAAFGVTVVLCTATQPAFEERTPWFRGFDPRPVEIVGDPAPHFRRLRRVRFETDLPELDSSALAKRLRSEPTVLCVVNTRKQAIELVDALDPDRTDPSVFHLSTLLCGRHRRRVLDDVRARLAAGLPTRLISTSIVEAGVDVDFPRLFRALAPLPSLIQAAGRCNREGRRPWQDSLVTLFRPAEDRTPSDPIYKKARDKTVNALRRAADRGEAFDFDDPENVTAWFREMIRELNDATDAHRVMPDIRAFDFPEVARKMRLIPDDTVTVLARAAVDLSLDLDTLLGDADRRGGLTRSDWRKLHPFCVQLYPNQADGLSEPVPGLIVYEGSYDPKTGVPLLHDPNDRVRPHSPEKLIR